MGPRSLVCNLLISVIVLVCIEKCYLQSISSSEVIFPDAKPSEHSLPVFPDVIAQYVEQKRRIAPAIDEYGRPRCLRNTGDTFCEEVEDYPEDLIHVLDLPNIAYRVPVYPEVPPNFIESEGAADTRSQSRVLPDPSHSDLTEETICPQSPRMIYPKAAVNEIDRWDFIINDNKYVQAVTAEICDFENKSCNLLDGILPFDTSSICRQKYAYKKLLALHPDQKKFYTGAFKFPSCCVCHIRNHHILPRIQIVNTEESSPMFRDFIRNSRATNLNVTDSNWTTRSNHTSIYDGSAASSEEIAHGFDITTSSSVRTATDISRSAQSSDRSDLESHRSTTVSNRDSADRTETAISHSIQNSHQSAYDFYRSTTVSNRNSADRTATTTNQIIQNSDGSASGFYESTIVSNRDTVDRTATVTHQSIQNSAGSASGFYESTTISNRNSADRNAKATNQSIQNSDRTAITTNKSIRNSDRNASGSYETTNISNRSSGDRTITETNKSLRNSDRRASGTYRSAMGSDRNVSSSDQSTNDVNGT